VTLYLKCALPLFSAEPALTLPNSEGGKQSIALGRLQQGDPRNLLLNTSGDPQAQIRALEEEMAQAQVKLAEVNQNQPDAGGKMRALHQQLDAAKVRFGVLVWLDGNLVLKR